jgi:plastocyanin
MRRRGVLVLVAVAIAVTGIVPLAPASETAQMSRNRTVSVRDNFFSPRNVTVHRTGIVTWRWRGSDLHNVRFRRLRSGRRPRGCSVRDRGTCRKRFRSRGTFRYVCTLHDGMVGSVRVR